MHVVTALVSEAGEKFKLSLSLVTVVRLRPVWAT